MCRHFGTRVASSGGRTRARRPPVADRRDVAVAISSVTLHGNRAVAENLSDEGQYRPRCFPLCLPGRDEAPNGRLCAANWTPPEPSCRADQRNLLPTTTLETTESRLGLSRPRPSAGLALHVRCGDCPMARAQRPGPRSRTARAVAAADGQLSRLRIRSRPSCSISRPVLC
jgi:hypothetical protein